ncbi:hypothetical protein [Paenibacillus daejeonensis]|uniref:hypothetical protein n=1 Tax=Paenibacillus daejeonensis TaxID=135193 RepID=UPI000375C97A|nr:hypothetical protein [Paenibacillus daejeonensis]
MRKITPEQYEERIEAVLDIAESILGGRRVPELLIRQLRSLSYDELGQLAMQIATTRSIEHLSKSQA